MASKRRIRRRECDRKVVLSQDEAVSRANALGRKSHCRMSAYRCRFGNHWHVGHMPFWLRQSIRDKRAVAA